MQRRVSAERRGAPAWAGADTRLPGGEGRPDDLPVADRQARTPCAQAQGRVAGGVPSRFGETGKEGGGGKWWENYRCLCGRAVGWPV
jgi:hypothetical protein